MDEQHGTETYSTRRGRKEDRTYLFFVPSSSSSEMRTQMPELMEEEEEAFNRSRRHCLGLVETCKHRRDHLTAGHYVRTCMDGRSTPKSTVPFPKPKACIETYYTDRIGVCCRPLSWDGQNNRKSRKQCLLGDRIIGSKAARYQLSWQITWFLTVSTHRKSSRTSSNS